jgi:hypothetical protein
MYAKRTPRIEYAAVVPSAVIGKLDADIPVEDLGLEKFTLKALQDAGIVNAGGAFDLLAAAAENPDYEIPKGLGARRLKELQDALDAKVTIACEGSAGGAEAAMIFAALEVVARRCGTRAMYHHGCILDIDGKRVLRIRWSAGADWPTLVRACKTADKHFHKCPLRAKGQADTVGELVD